MPRKPLLTTPTLNAQDVRDRLGAGDLMGRVIENDAAKHGRAPSPTPTTAEAVSSVEGDAVVNKLINKQVNQSNNERTNNLVSSLDNSTGDSGAGAGQATGAPQLDPLTLAYLATLSQPFPPTDAKSPRVLVAGRVQGEVSERFELVCTMLKKKGDKQDVLNRALQVFIEHVVERQGEVEI